jgi:hypothetical protein
MQNEERPGEATSCDIKATSMRVESQAVATPMRPQSHPNATSKPPPCDFKATTMRLQSHHKATSRLPQSANKATLRRLEGVSRPVRKKTDEARHPTEPRPQPYSTQLYNRQPG